MALVPDDKLIKAIQKETKKQLRKKKLAQAARFKGFKLPTGGGPGVIPEADWKEMKK